MVILNAEDGKILDTLPIGKGSDGAVFNPQPWKRSVPRATVR